MIFGPPRALLCSLDGSILDPFKGKSRKVGRELRTDLERSPPGSKGGPAEAPKSRKPRNLRKHMEKSRKVWRELRTDPEWSRPESKGGPTGVHKSRKPRNLRKHKGKSRKVGRELRMDPEGLQCSKAVRWVAQKSEAEGRPSFALVRMPFWIRSGFPPAFF